MTSETMKRCPRCTQMKDRYTEFTLAGYCKPCQIEYSREYSAKIPAKKDAQMRANLRKLLTMNNEQIQAESTRPLIRSVMVRGKSDEHKQMAQYIKSQRPFGYDFLTWYQFELKKRDAPDAEFRNLAQLKAIFDTYGRSL
jgi:hypothetical protein